MDRRIDWIIQKGALGAALYFALVAHVEWLQYAVAAYVWWTLAITVWTVPQIGTARRMPPPDVPPIFAIAFDAAVLASMFLAHWYWTAFAYALASACLALAQARSEGKL